MHMQRMSGMQRLPHIIALQIILIFLYLAGKCREFSAVQGKHGGKQTA